MRRRFMSNKITPININNYLTIEAKKNGLRVCLSTNACEYCIDGDGNWKSLLPDTYTEFIDIGQTLSFRGKLLPEHLNGIGTFTISEECNLLGNCMSLIFGDNAANNYSLVGRNSVFSALFKNCNYIISVSENFLPATTLSIYCYDNMFNGCSSLTTAPELPATTLAGYCYYNMFNGCKKLNYIKMLATGISADGCLTNWVSGVASTGTFVKNKNATWNVMGVSGIPYGWTIQKV